MCTFLLSQHTAQYGLLEKSEIEEFFRGEVSRHIAEDGYFAGSVLHERLSHISTLSRGTGGRRLKACSGRARTGSGRDRAAGSIVADSAGGRLLPLPLTRAQVPRLPALQHPVALPQVLLQSSR